MSERPSLGDGPVVTPGLRSLTFHLHDAPVRWGWRIRLPAGGGVGYRFGYVQAGAPTLGTLH